MKISKHENKWFSVNEIDQPRRGAALIAKHLMEGMAAPSLCSYAIPLRSAFDAASAIRGVIRRMSSMSSLIGFLRRCRQGRSFFLNDRGGFAGRGPAGNTLPRDFAHRIEDRDVRDIICFVDPAALFSHRISSS